MGEPGWFAAPASLGYAISFENKPTASLPATIVTITTQLDEDTDWSTFELGDLGWGDVLVDVPSGLQQWTGRVPLHGTDDVVDVEAGLDAASGAVTWTLTTIDPAIEDIPDDAGAGFLPPNGDRHEGEGFVDYTVAPASTDTGTEITAQARIVFDENDPIDTNTWRNTIDADRPVATLADLPGSSAGPVLDLAWSATDGGSGAVTYDLYAQVDGSELFLYRRGVDTTSARVPVTVGTRYGFAVIATDAVGHQEAGLDGAEVTTLVVGSSTSDGGGGGEVPTAPRLEPWERSIDAACAGASAPRFPDVGDGAVHGRAIACIGGFDIARGFVDGDFRPSLPISRAQMATFLVRALRLAGVSIPDVAADAFDDDDGSVHEPNIDALAALGIVSGTGDDAYAPDAPVSRAQMASYLARAAALVLGRPLASAGDVFDDDDDSTHEAAIDAVAAAGITAGTAGRSYDPTSPVTRGQMATFLARFLSLLVEEGHPLS